MAADHQGMDQQRGIETGQMVHDRLRRRGVVVVVLAIVVLGLVDVTALAFVGRDKPRVVALTTAPRGAADPSAHAPDTTTTLEPVSTTALTVATTSPAATTPASTAPHGLSPTVPAPSATPPSTSAAPKTTTTIVTAASFKISPSTARFPSTPPPYSPMPIVNVTITNTGGATARSVVVHPVGVYSVPSSTCSTLLAGQSCVAEVQFCPTSPNHYLNTLMVTGEDAATGSTVRASIPLDGTAT
jgi:hypothetical protein